MKKFVSTILVSLLFAQFTYCMIEGTSPADSLRRLLDITSQNDTARLSILRKLALMEQSTEKGLQLSKQLYNEADRMNSDMYKCYAYYYSIIYYYNRTNKDSLDYYVNLVKPLAEKEKLWLVYFETLKFQINMLSIGENFELAIDQALKMRNKAKEINYVNGIIAANTNLAVAYISSNRNKEGNDALEEAYDLLKQSDNELITVSVLSMLLNNCTVTKDYSKFWVYARALEGAMERHIAKNSFSESYYTIYLFIEIQIAYYYINNSQPDSALQHLKKAETYLPYNTYPMYELIYHDAYAEYYMKTDQYQKALAEIDSTIADIKSISQKDYYNILIRKADILVKTGEEDKAMPLYQEALFGKDSLSQASSHRQMEQIQQIYNVNKLLYENNLIKTKRQIIILIVIVVILILMLTFAIRTLFVRRTLKEAEQKMREATQGAEEANEIKNRFLTNMSYNIRTPLNGVVGFSQLLAIDPHMDESMRKEYSAIIKQNSDELMKLVNNVLDLSRLESGMMKFSLLDYDINTLCHEAMYTARSKGDPIKRILKIEIEEHLIRTDIARFNQMLTSAITYPTSCDNEREITIRVALDDSATQIKVWITGSPLADPVFNNQEVIVRNDINRLFLKHFGGTYTIDSNSPDGPTIVFTHPLISK